MYVEFAQKTQSKNSWLTRTNDSRPPSSQQLIPSKIWTLPQRSAMKFVFFLRISRIGETISIKLNSTPNFSRGPRSQVRQRPTANRIETGWRFFLENFSLAANNFPKGNQLRPKVLVRVRPSFATHELFMCHLLRLFLASTGRRELRSH